MAAVAVAAGPAAAAAPRTPTPTPSTTKPTLPVPRATVAPEASVGGPRLASMKVVTDLPEGVPAPPKLKNVSWVLADLDTGEVIAAKAAHARLRPASTLKVLTALTLLPKVPADAVVKATAAHASADGTRVGLVPGLAYTGKQLFQGLLMASGNDAAYALADAGGGREAVLAEMNARAAELGAHDTVAKDPSGLDVPGQVSSAYDLALIGRAAMQRRDFRTYVATRQVSFPGKRDPKTKKRSTFKVGNHNTLLYNYDGTIGVKNGYTEKAHRTFISAVTRGGKTYLLTEMYGLDFSWRPQAAMYDWAFRYGSRARPVGRLVEPGEVTTPPTPTPTPSPTDTAAGTPEDGVDSALGAGAASGGSSRDDDNRSLTGSAPPWAGVAALALLAAVVAASASRSRRGRRGRPAGRRVR